MNNVITGFSLVFLIIPILLSCSVEAQVENKEVEKKKIDTQIIPGAWNTENYIQLLKNKNVGLTVNQSALIGTTHLADSLLALGIDVKKIFSPEHGFRGDKNRGAHIDDEIDEQTGLPIISIYGSKRKPDIALLEDLDIMIYDIQDVGARFYTYISTMSNIMEACAQADLPLIILDRPNPNGFYVDGPIMESDWTSFIGMHEVPIVHGMTSGEYAQMVKGEAWIENAAKLDLTVIACKNYDHTMTYKLPVKPSPNLPNLRSILLYPSLCLFEGTVVSVGRGTDQQFQVIGHPDLDNLSFSFTPQTNSAENKPKHEGNLCFGFDYSSYSVDTLMQIGRLQLEPLLYMHEQLGESVFNDNNFFEKLAGTEKLRQQIHEGKSEDEIRASWQEGLDKFKKIREKYLLYADF